MAMSQRALTERDLDVLRALHSFETYGPSLGARPLDIGGRNGSHHSATLNKLADRGFVERKLRNFQDSSRPAYRYKLTGQGRSLVQAAPDAAKE